MLLVVSVIGLSTLDLLFASGPIVVPDQNVPSNPDSEPQVSDVRTIPGAAGWVASTGTYSNGFRFCWINRNIEDGVRVAFTVSEKGTLALVVEDKYMEAQVSSVLDWLKEGQSYRAVLHFDNEKKMFTVQAVRTQQHKLLIPLKAIDRETVFRAKHVLVSVAAIAARGYDLTGLEVAGPELLECARQVQRTKPSNP